MKVLRLFRYFYVIESFENHFQWSLSVVLVITICLWGRIMPFILLFFSKLVFLQFPTML